MGFKDLVSQAATQAPAVGQLAGDQLTEWMKDYKKATNTLETIGFVVGKFMNGMGVLPEVHTTLSGKIASIQKDRVEQLIISNDNAVGHMDHRRVECAVDAAVRSGAHELVHAPRILCARRERGELRVDHREHIVEGDRVKPLVPVEAHLRQPVVREHRHLFVSERRGETEAVLAGEALKLGQGRHLSSLPQAGDRARTPR